MISVNETVLVVEDVDPIRALFELMLRQKGFEVRLAHDGPSAMKALDTFGAPPTLVVLDVQLPRTNTLQLIDSLRDRWPTVPLLLTSGVPLDELPLRIGDFAFLPKPFNFHTVGKSLEMLLHRVLPDTFSLN